MAGNPGSGVPGRPLPGHPPGTVGSNVKIELPESRSCRPDPGCQYPEQWVLSAGLFPPDWRQHQTTKSGSRAPPTVHTPIRATATLPSRREHQPRQLLLSRSHLPMEERSGISTLLMRSPGVTRGSPGSTVKIVLLKGGTEVGTIAGSVPVGSSGKGSYSWFVPTTLVSGSDYKVSVQSISQPAVRDLSNANFKICWA